jgi:hypothetical protein
LSGLHATPPSWSCRLIALTAYFTAVILFVAYSAIFISFLTVMRYELPFRDFSGFLADSTYRLAIIEGSADKEYFMVKPMYNR